MKFATIPAFLLSLNVYAESYSYICNSIDDNQPNEVERIDLDIRDDTSVAMKIYYVNPSVDLYSIDEKYAPRSEKMKLFYRFYTEKGNLDPFMVEKVLFEGGKKLRGGDLGGIIKTDGHGYSWANYLCVERD